MNKTTTTGTDHDPERLALLQAQKAEIERDAMQCVRDEDAAGMLFFRQGMLVLRARKSGVYRLDGYETAEAYVRALLKCSEKSLARRLRIVKVFTEAEYRELLSHKVKPTTIERIARLPADIRPTIIEIAHQSDHNPTVRAVIARWQKIKAQAELAKDPRAVLLKAALAELRAEQKAADKSGRGKGQGQAAVAQAQAVQAAQAAQVQAEAQAQAAEVRAQAAEAQVGEARARAVAAERRAADEGSQVAQLRAELQRAQAELAARRANEDQLAQRERRLDERERQLEARERQLEARREERDGREEHLPAVTAAPSQDKLRHGKKDPPAQPQRWRLHRPHRGPAQRRSVLRDEAWLSDARPRGGIAPAPRPFHAQPQQAQSP